MERLPELITKRGRFKAIITRNVNWYSAANDTFRKGEISSRLEQINKAFLDFTEVQMAIDLLTTTEDEADKQQQETTKFENDYFAIKGIFEDIFQTFEILNRTRSETEENADSNANLSNPKINVKLPQISLPDFDGSYDKWSTFHDLFKSLIHENHLLANVQKLYYLQTSLKGEATQIIAELELTDDNYPIAWDLLVGRYENKRKRINTHLQNLLELPNLTKDCSTSLRYFLDTYQKNMRALNNLEDQSEHWNSFLLFLLESKFDSVTNKDWDSSGKVSEVVEDLIEFLKERHKNLDKRPISKKLENTRQKTNINTKFNPIKQVHVATTFSTCIFCNEKHYINQCKNFLKLDPMSRLNEVRKLKACTNCLKKGHFSLNCTSSLCKVCQKKHHTILHLENHSNNTTNTNSESNIQNINNTSNSRAELPLAHPQDSLSAHSQNPQEMVILSTALVYILDSNNTPIKCRALLDSGSQSSFITTELFNKLNLKHKKINFPIVGITEANGIQVSKSCTAKVKSLNSSYNFSTSFLVLNKITGMVPQCNIDISSMDIPQNLNLADPSYFESSQIDLLLGANIFYELLLPNQIKINKHHPILQDSKLGWIVSGPMHSRNSKGLYAHFSQSGDIQKQLEAFWLVEEIPNNRNPILSKEEYECEQDFKLNFSKDVSGRFIVKLPVKENFENLGSSREGALRRFQTLERRFLYNNELKQNYSKFIREYIELNHMTLIKEPQNEPFNFYLPHHCVKKDTSLTTKFRVVFDASAKSDSGLSLNDVLKVGPTIQDDIFSIVTRFRTHNIVFTADIAKMYRQILIHPDQRNLQCIFWRFDPSEPLCTYKMNTVTYGTSPASFLATRCLKQLAIENEIIYPESSQSISDDFYMDDYISGATDEISAITRIKEVSSILSSAGFVLRQWVSNKPSILSELNVDSSDVEYIIKDNQDSKTLGLYWNPKDDSFRFVPSPCIKYDERVTKRTILSTIARIFDILGLIGPIIVTAKIMLQRLWQLKSDWDEPVPIEIFTDWKNFYSQMCDIAHIRIPRSLLLNSFITVELHGFCDASIRAFGACIYLRSIKANGDVLVELSCSKSRVAPLKTISLPRLELCGALLLAQLCSQVKLSLKNIHVEKCFLWTDSTIVLSWLKLEPNRLKTFVANRVTKITEMTNSDMWSHVPTKQNPADIISRGVYPNQLQHNKLWWNGPEFLKLDITLWPKSNYDLIPVPDLEEVKPTCLTTLIDDSLLEKYSSYNRLIRTVAFVLRFFHNSRLKGENRQNRHSGSLQLDEVENSKIVLSRLVQQKYFAEEIRCLSKNSLVPNKSKLKCLNPFLDKSGLIRVGGRLSNSALPLACKFPIAIPSKGNFTKLVILNAHVSDLHAGPQHVLSRVRTEFWPLSGRRTVRSILSKCMICFRTKPLAFTQKMGDLPADRVNVSRVFSKIGVDYAGPYLIKDSKLRNRKYIKAYICIFICLATKAIHIELVTELTAEGFLNIFKRFVARRGLCSDIYSDNAGNFTAANRELKEFAALSSTDKFKTFLIESKIRWHFIPSRSPHFGGLWESAVRSIKFHLKRIIHNVYLSYEDFYTLLTQIESILNSRPITPLTEDPNDLQPLTPGHFIIGSALTSFNEPVVSSCPTTLVSRYKHIQLLVQHFWNRWSKDYLHHLQVRSKWSADPKVVELGSLVLLKDDNTPPRDWRLGRIVELHPGKDNIVRAVSVKTQNSVVKRAMSKVSVLPMNC